MENVEQIFTKSNQCLPTHCKTPIIYGYRPETDTSSELKYEVMTQYKEMVRVLIWAVNLGQVDIFLETSLMSTYLSLPFRGNLEQISNKLGYLKVNSKINIFFYPEHPTIDERSFSAHDWYDFYRYAKEAIPADALTPRANVVSTQCFVDMDHAGNRAARRSQTGVLIFVNKAPMIWYSKQ